MRWMPGLIASGWLLAGFVAGSIAAEPVHIVLDDQAPALEKLAAQELQAMIAKLSTAEITISSRPPAQGKTPVIFLGSPQTNRIIGRRLKGFWPKVSDQGIVIRSLGQKQAVIIGGGSPRATLWAVYEFGYQQGIRYLLREDIYPDPKPLKISGLDYVNEPEFRTRSWRTINDFAIGPESWSLAEHKQVLKQLAKQKFNQVMLAVYPWQPFVDYRFQGINKKTAMLWYGERFELPRGAPGRNALRGLSLFENPEFTGKTSYQEMTAAGIRYANGIITESQRLGMKVGILVSPLAFPKEFAPVLKGSKAARGLNQLTMTPGAGQQFDDKTLQDLVATKLRAYLKTYPTVDSLYLTLPEFPEWEEHAEAAWKFLSSRPGASLPTLASLVEAAGNRSLIASGARGRQALKGNVVALAFLHHLLSGEHADLLKRPDGQRVQLVVRSVDPELYPYLDQLLPAGAGTLNFVDYTARRVDENSDYLAKIPTTKVKAQFITTLADDNIGPLAQQVTQRLESLVNKIRENGWDGFSTRYWMLADLDPAVHFLSRASWDPEVTARSAHDALFTTITGRQEVADRLWLAMQQIEKATELTDQKNLGFNFPVKGMLMKHHHPTPVPEWWDEVNELYTNAMIELYRSHGAADPRSRRLLFYWAKRGEYVLEYLATIRAVREASLATKAGDQDAALEQYEIAMEKLYNAIDTLSDVVQDQGDRGLIAVLNKFAFAPLKEQYEKVIDEE